MNKEVKVKILDMTYDRDNNLFQMHIEELIGDHKKTVLAVAGADFGIKKGMPPGLAEQFCESMKGKEKNLHIERDYSSISDARKIKDTKMTKDDVIRQEELNRINSNIDSYPIDEVMNNLHSKSKEKGNED